MIEAKEVPLPGMKKRHFTIPVFIPEEACPNRCVFCNQHHIAGTERAPSVSEVIDKVNEFLATIPPDSETEIGFFGGNFTGIPRQEQIAYLASVQTYIEKGQVSGIRISTRPDYIDQESLQILRKFHVRAIELGAQSFDEQVLLLAGRGHTVRQVHEASAMIKDAGFSLGLQMMIGLPGDTREKSLFTANEIIRLGADNTRIYPTLVIKDTELEQLFHAGKYQPLSLGKAVDQVAELVPLFIQSGVKILRIGLHPSEGLIDHTSLVAGPFHVAFGEMVFTEIWRRVFKNMFFENGKRNLLTLTLAPGMRNAAIGHKAMNKAILMQNFRKVVFTENADLKGFEYHAHTL